MAFKKVDLHVHSPASSCYEDHVMPETRRRTSPQDIVEAALAAGLGAIALTDHNSVEGLAALREAARDDLTVFPGAELATRGGHLLALFPVHASPQDLRQFIASLGFANQGIGDGFYQADIWLDEACKQIASVGGLAVAAHADRYSRGFLAGAATLADKMRIYRSPHLSALEITLPKDKERWNRGLMPNYPLGRACVQGSDAHSTKEIGRRFTYIDIPEMSLDGLRRALEGYSACIRFPEEMPQSENSSPG